MDDHVAKTAPKEPERLTPAQLVGKWYSGYDRNNKPAIVFEVLPGGVVEASSYYANRGRAKLQLNANRMEIVVPATWGPIFGRPYLKWTLAYKDGNLEGQSTFWNTAPPEHGGDRWYESYPVKLKRVPSSNKSPPRPSKPRKSHASHFSRRRRAVRPPDRGTGRVRPAIDPGPRGRRLCDEVRPHRAGAAQGLRSTTSCAKALEQAKAKSGEVQVSLFWSSKNDLDLHVVCPSGERIFYGNRNPASGGRLDVDMNVSYEQASAAPSRTSTGRPARCSPAATRCTFTITATTAAGRGRPTRRRSPCASRSRATPS